MPNSAPINAPSLNYGREQEKNVFQKYSSMYSLQMHRDVNVRSTGMRVSNDDPWLAATADGVYTCSCHGQGVLEIKAPYRWRAHNPEEAVEDEDFYLDRSFNLKTSHQYYCQIQIQMHVYNFSWCDFVV